MNYQDIHASDIDSWKSFREKYQSGDFAGAQAIAQTLTNTQINAQALNDSPFPAHFRAHSLGFNTADYHLNISFL